MFVWLIQAVLVGLGFGVAYAARKAHSGENLFSAASSAFLVNVGLMIWAAIYLGSHGVNAGDAELLVVLLAGIFAPWLSALIGYGVVLAFKQGTTSPARGSSEASKPPENSEL